MTMLFNLGVLGMGWPCVGHVGLHDHTEMIALV